MTIEKIDSLEKLSTRFRELINLPRRNYDLCHRKNDYYKLCAAMDIIGDVSKALRSYLENDHNDKGLAYLEIFGVLNSLNIQQDALRRLHKIILTSEINLVKDYPEIKKIRKIRIHVAGHPVTGDGASHFIIRFTLTREWFEYQSLKPNGNSTISKINLYECIENHLDALEEVTQKLISHMEDEDKIHKEQFMGDSLAKIFEGHSYFSSKLFEGLENRTDISAINVKCIFDILVEFESTLEKRSAHFADNDSSSYVIKRLKYAVSKYQQYLDNDPSTNQDDAYIMASYIQTELNKLVEMAKMIDEDYSS